MTARYELMEIDCLTRKRRAAPKFPHTPSGGLAKPGLGALSRSEPRAWQDRA